MAYKHCSTHYDIDPQQATSLTQAQRLWPDLYGNPREPIEYVRCPDCGEMVHA